MNIRIAQYKDLKSIVEIYNQAISVGQKTADITSVKIKDKIQWFKDHRAKKYPILVAEKNNKVIGYLSISPYRPGRMALKYSAEVSYFINFKNHRQGVASNLLRKAIELCPELSIKTLFAILIDTNESSVNLLEKFGFKQWGHLPKIAMFDEIEVGQYYYGLRI
jgi:L-amino acid N-acyltransferase YncA